MSTLYRTLRLNVDAVDHVKIGPSEASAQDEQTPTIFNSESVDLKIDMTSFFEFEQVYVKCVVSQIFFKLSKFM